MTPITRITAANGFPIANPFFLVFHLKKKLKAFSQTVIFFRHAHSASSQGSLPTAAIHTPLTARAGVPLSRAVWEKA
jgi:hypothetical protein